MKQTEANLIVEFIQTLVEKGPTNAEHAELDGADEAPKCQIHKYKDEPITMIKRSYNGKSWYDHRSQINGVWQKCYGDGWKD